MKQHTIVSDFQSEHTLVTELRSEHTIKMMSFDVSSRSTGASLFLNGIYYTSFLLKADSATEQKKQLWDFLDKHDPDIIVVERPTVLRNAKTQSVLDRLVGVLEWWAIFQSKNKEVDFVEYRPNEWRSLVKSKEEKLPKKRKELKEWANARACLLVKSEYDPISIETEDSFRFSIETEDDISESILIGYARLVESGITSVS